MDESSISGLNIYSADSYGRGVGRHEGKVIFVPYAAPGDTIECNIVSREANYDIGRLVRIIEPSPHRMEPPCPYFGACPGCSFQHIDYELELKLKGERIAKCMEKFGGAEGLVVGVTGSPQMFGYRNHVTLHLWYNGLDAGCGLIESERRRVMHIDSCMLLPDFARDLPSRIVARTKEVVGSYKGRFALRLPFIFNHADRTAMLVPGRSRMNKMRRMMRLVSDALQDEYPPSSYLQRFIEGRLFRFSPLSFSQANETLMPSLYSRAREAIGVGRRERVLDLYSGVGVLGILSAGQKMTTFVELSPSAVEDLRWNVKVNDIAGA